MRKKLLMFDLDGTIADTIWTIRYGVNMAMRKYGFPEKSYEEVRLAIGNGAKNLMRRCIPENRRDDDSFVNAVLADYDKFYGLTYANIDGCYEGMREAICELKNRGCIIAVLSNKQDHYVKKIVQALFDKDTVSWIQGQTDMPQKPDPTVPLMIAEHFGVRPDDCAFIGDSDVDVMTAKNAGMTAVACAWGYRPREVLTDADRIIESPCELTEIFE